LIKLSPAVRPAFQNFTLPLEEEENRVFTSNFGKLSRDDELFVVMNGIIDVFRATLLKDFLMKNVDLTNKLWAHS
jgi:hypothetical protein